MFLFCTRLSFAKSIALMDTAPMEWDASLSMTSQRSILALNFRLLHQHQILALKNPKWVLTQQHSISQTHPRPLNLSLRKFKSLSNHKPLLRLRLVPGASATSKLPMLSRRKRLSTETFLFTAFTTVCRSIRRRQKCFKRKWPRKSIWTTFSSQKSTTWTYILLKSLAWRCFKTSQMSWAHTMVRTKPTKRVATSTETPPLMSNS